MVTARIKEHRIEHALCRGKAAEQHEGFALEECPGERDSI
jgi:hypothetical protein